MRQATWTPHNITRLSWGCPLWREQEDGRQAELTVRSPYENLCSSIMHNNVQHFPNSQCPVCGAAL